MTFELQTLEGKIPGAIPEQHIDTIVEAFTQYKESGKVSIHGIVKCDRRERPIRLEAIEDIVLLDPLDVLSRLDELRILKDGWLDGEGLAPAPQLVEWLAESFERHFPDDLSLPYLYPTVEGGVQAEWSLSAREISLRFHPDNRTAEWHDLALDTDEEDTRELDLAEGQDWEWLAARVVALSQPT